MYAAALEYAAAGVWTFPVRVAIAPDGHKVVQPVAHWREASAIAPATLAGWWAAGGPWADASIAIDCGRSGLVVVDVDEGEGKAGRATWAALAAEHAIAATAAHAATPGGGEHLFYREHPRRVVGIDSSGKVAAAIDVRGLGGFVLAWPSSDARGAYGRVDLVALGAAPVVPDVVVERMTARPAAPAVGPAAVVPQTRSEAIWAEFAPTRAFTRVEAERFCTGPLRAFEAMRTPDDHGFNAALNALACVWSHFVPAFVSAGQAEGEIYAAALANGSVEWQGEGAVRATIRSGLGQTRDPWRAVRAPEPVGTGPEPVAAGVPERRLRLGNFAGIRDRRRADPAYLKRTDGVALLYPGKDSYLYAETESGKSWLALLAVVQCVTDGVPVIVVDFEEGDELEYGTRLLDLGLPESQLTDPARFRYVMPDGPCTDEIMTEAADMGARVVINEGMSVAYDVYGLQVKENDSATAFRRQLVKPHLVAGRAVLTTDHVVKDRESRGRYAIGGVMKLNAASGGAYLLANVEGFAPGKRGASVLYVTKDRPGGVKRHGVGAGDRFDPQVRRIGTLVVDDSRAWVTYLDVSVLPPAADDAAAAEPAPLADRLLEAIDRLRAAGRPPSLRAIRGEGLGRFTDVADEVERLLTRHLLVESSGPRSARIFDRFPVPAEVVQ